MKRIIENRFIADKVYKGNNSRRGKPPAAVFVLVRMLYIEDTLGEKIVKPSDEGKDENAESSD